MILIILHIYFWLSLSTGDLNPMCIMSSPSSLVW